LKGNQYCRQIDNKTSVPHVDSTFVSAGKWWTTASEKS
jgi:hypothetical protein